MADFDYEKIASSLDKLLGSVDLSSTSEEGVRFQLPEGYFRCLVEKAELKESKSGNPMVSFELKTMEDGKKSIVDEQGYAQLVDAPHTADKKIYINYVLSNELQVGFFVSDMLKFQDLETNEPFFTADDFSNTEGIIQVCDVLATGAEIYIMVQNTDKKNDKGETIQNFKPITWNRARRIGVID